MKYYLRACTLLVTLALFSCGQDSSTSSKSGTVCATVFESGESFSNALSKKTKFLVKISDKSQVHDLKQNLVEAHIGAGEVQFKQVNQKNFSVEIPLGSPARAVLDKYLAQGKIDFVEPDQETFLVTPGKSGTQDLSSSLKSVATALHATATNPKEIVVAVIDSGVDYTHKDLAPYMWHNPGEIPNNGIDDDHNGYVDDYYGYDFANNDSDPMADDTRAYHGTHVAGIVQMASEAAELGINVKIMALKYLNSQGAGQTSNAVRALDYAIANGVNIINNSWGSYTFSQALFDAIERTRKANILFVAAAGNGDIYGNAVNVDNIPFYPASYNHGNIISVAAHNDQNVLTSWSNYGRVRVDVAAPGNNIRSTRNGNTYATLSGTSMASPYVAGVAGLLWSLRGDLSYLEIRDIITSSVDKTPEYISKLSSGGQVDRDKAINMAQEYVHGSKSFNVPEFTPRECTKVN
jgi:subtilisin family serine protease